jgi:DNA-directed RNA polymerase specialized sigma24 family protein
LVAAIENTDNGPSVEPVLFSGERAMVARHTAATIDAAIATMDPEDQVILRLRFWNARTIPEIARSLKLDGKKLYKRIGKLLGQLKFTLEGAGVEAADAREILGHSDHELAFAFPDAEGKPEFRHSKPLDAVGAAKGN